MAVSDKIHIQVGRGYDVMIGQDLLSESGQFIRDVMGQRNCVIVTDSNIAPLYLRTVVHSCENYGYSPKSFIFEAGEGRKNLTTFGCILESLADARLTRSDFVIALGGGVTGDISGFAAGCYMRGIPFVQIPTTVLAMVDSSVGGKCAVDLPQGKNLAGVFHQPSLVICDTDTLETLPPEIFADGCAEAIKTGILAGGELQELLQREDWREHISRIISLCIAYKGGVVERDETEQGERKLLNLGHTAAHAIEKCSGYAVSHGRAVAIGTAMMARAADRLGWSTEPLGEMAEATLQRFGLPVSTGYSPEKLLEAALSDKKRAGKQTTIVVPESVGNCVLRTVDDVQLLEVFRTGWR